MAAHQLFFAGKFNETQNMCDTVLSLDPDDSETSDLKGEANHFLKNPSQFDVNKIRIIRDNDQPAIGRNGGGGLFRSVSERSRARKRFQQRVSNYQHGHSLANGTSVVEDTDEVFSTTDVSITEVNGSPPKRGLTRTQSESGKSALSVLQKIQSFEQVARKSTGSVNGKPPPASRISTGSNITTPHASSKDTSGIPPQTPVIPENESPPVCMVSVLGTPRRHGPTSVATKLGQIKKIESYEDSITDSPTYISTRKAEVIWSAHAKSVPLEVQTKLEKLFFSSHLLTSACFTNLDGDILGSTKNCKISKSELVTLIHGMRGREYFTSSKIMLGGKEYSCLSGTGHIVRARIYQEGLGVNCTIFDKTMAIGFYSSPTLPKPVGQLMSAIAKTNGVGVGEYV